MNSTAPKTSRPGHTFSQQTNTTAIEGVTTWFWTYHIKPGWRLCFTFYS